MSRILGVRNRQRVRAVDTRLLRRIARWALEEQFQAADYELGLHLVAAAEMALLNWQYLQHSGSTDVLTFDHRQNVAATVRSRAGFLGSSKRSDVPRTSHQTRALTVAATAATPLHGEIFLCLDDAVAQARQFDTAWQSELARYLLHGLLHLHGFDDLTPAARREMKRQENRLLRLAERQFPLRRLARPKR
jgi:probable rRNA maturation factor